MLSTSVFKALKRSSPLVLTPREVVLDGKHGAEMLWFAFVGDTIDLKLKEPGQSSAPAVLGSAERAGRLLSPPGMAPLTAALPNGRLSCTHIIPISGKRSHFCFKDA